LVSYSAPKAAMKNKPTKSKYGAANLAMIKRILETEPELLRMFGMDPETARREVEKSEQGKN